MRLFLSISLVLLLTLACWPAVGADKIIMISNAEPPEPEDQAVIDHLIALGFDVESHASSETQPVDVSGAVAVVIGELLGSGSVSDAYKDTTIPVIITEAFILDNMKLATDGTFNTDDTQTLTIVNANHPIAGGLTGDVEISTAVSGVCSTSDIAASADIVAVVKENGHVAVATFEAGAADMDGNPIPARRVFVNGLAETIPIFTDAAWGLIERSVLWALDMVTPVNPEGAATVTWGALKADYR